GSSLDPIFEANSDTLHNSLCQAKLSSNDSTRLSLSRPASPSMPSARTFGAVILLGVMPLIQDSSASPVGSLWESSQALGPSSAHHQMNRASINRRVRRSQLVRPRSSEAEIISKHMNQVLGTSSPSGLVPLPLDPYGEPSQQPDSSPVAAGGPGNAPPPAAEHKPQEHPAPNDDPSKGNGKPHPDGHPQPDGKPHPDEKPQPDGKPHPDGHNPPDAAAGPPAPREGGPAEHPPPPSADPHGPAGHPEGHPPSPAHPVNEGDHPPAGPHGPEKPKTETTEIAVIAGIRIERIDSIALPSPPSAHPPPPPHDDLRSHPEEKDHPPPPPGEAHAHEGPKDHDGPKDHPPAPDAEHGHDGPKGPVAEKEHPEPKQIHLPGGIVITNDSKVGKPAEAGPQLIRITSDKVKFVASYLLSSPFIS
ncbi:hypothetical protein PSTT_10591, partial [Puccinia striiformis]